MGGGGIKETKGEVEFVQMGTLERTVPTSVSKGS
jgi:hypothetical protein